MKENWNWNVDFSDPAYQSEFLESRARFPAMVAAWGTGKTMTALAKGMALSLQYPNNLGLVLRKNFTDLKDSTMADFERYTSLKVKAQSKSVDLPNGSRIIFHHADELSGVVQNINLGWFFIEQAEEFDSDEVFEKLGGRLRREGCFRQGFIIANTNGHNWIWRKWKNAGGEEYICDTPFDPPTGIEGVEYDGYASLTEARTHDNIKNLPEDFIVSLEVKKETAPSHYRRYVLNSWEDTDTADKLISYQDILNAVGRDLRDYDTTIKVIACDPAEFGDDKTVIYVLDGCKVIDSKVMIKKSVMETAGWIVATHRKHNTDKIIIDDIGIGAGVRASVRETLDPHNDSNLVMGYNSSRTPRDKVHYVRSRDEIYDNAAKLFKDGYVSIIDDNDLVEDLAAITYSLNSKGQMMMARKKDIKKLLGRSPDHADALVMGLWAAKIGHKRELVLVGTDEDDYDPLTFEM